MVEKFGMVLSNGKPFLERNAGVIISLFRWYKYGGQITEKKESLLINKRRF